MNNIKSCVQTLITVKYLYENAYIVVPIAMCAIDISTFIIGKSVKGGYKAVRSYVSYCKCDICMYRRQKGIDTDH